MDIKAVINIGTWNTTTNLLTDFKRIYSINNMFKRANGAYETWACIRMAFADDGLTDI